MGTGLFKNQLMLVPHTLCAGAYLLAGTDYRYNS